MSNVIQIKRGNGVPNKKLEPYELGFNRDNHCLYIGTGSGKNEDCIPIRTEGCPLGLFGGAAVRNMTAVNKNGEGQNVVGPIRKTQNELVVDAETLRWWDGCHTDRESNLKYCYLGQFGGAATKNVSGRSTENGQVVVTYISDATDDALINGLTIRHWDGRYTNGTTNSSYLAYCNQGAFGNAATRNTISGTPSAVGPIVDDDNGNLLRGIDLRWWNGCYESGKSNLAYCNQGAFGTAATKNVDATIKSGSTNLITSGGVYSSVYHSGNFHLPYTSIFYGRTLNASNPSIIATFEAGTTVNSGETPTTTRKFSDANFYLFYAAFDKANNGGATGNYYDFLLVPRTQIPNGTTTSDARSFVLSSGKDSKFFSIYYNNNTKQLVIENQGYDGGGSNNDTFGMYCIN